MAPLCLSRNFRDRKYLQKPTEFGECKPSNRLEPSMDVNFVKGIYMAAKPGLEA